MNNTAVHASKRLKGFINISAILVLWHLLLV